MWQYNHPPIMHYGVKGMKWGVKRKQDAAEETKQFHEKKFTPTQ